MATILLTGASRGIGAAALVRLRAAGHTVIGQSTRGGDGLLAADFAHAGAATQLWQAALAAAGGRIDVLVNNAGVFEAVDIDASDDEFEAMWARSLAVNLQSAAELCRHAVRHFCGAGGGRIVLYAGDRFLCLETPAVRPRRLASICTVRQFMPFLRGSVFHRNLIKTLFIFAKQSQNNAF